MTRAYVPIKVGQQRSGEWHLTRRTGIGSSDAATILGWGAYGRHPLDVWMEKTGSPQPDRDSSAMRAGRYFEDAVARMWADEHDRTLITPPAILRSTRWPFMLASLDRGVVAGPRARKIVAPLEVKCVWHGWDAWDDGLPDHVAAQVIHQLCVLDLDTGYVAALIGGKVQTHTVTTDRELREEFARTVRAWWDRHIVNGQRPDLDTPPADRRLIARAVPRPEHRNLPADEHAAGIVLDYGKARDWATSGKRAQDELGDRLARILADHERLTHDGQNIATFAPDVNGRRVLKVYPQRLTPKEQK